MAKISNSSDVFFLYSFFYESEPSIFSFLIIDNIPFFGMVFPEKSYYVNKSVGIAVLSFEEI